MPEIIHDAFKTTVSWTILLFKFYVVIVTVTVASLAVLLAATQSSNEVIFALTHKEIVHEAQVIYNSNAKSLLKEEPTK